jgi:hypothetical protein
VKEQHFQIIKKMIQDVHAQIEHECKDLPYQLEQQREKEIGFAKHEWNERFKNLQEELDKMLQMKKESLLSLIYI